MKCEVTRETPVFTPASINITVHTDQELRILRSIMQMDISIPDLLKHMYPELDVYCVMDCIHEAVNNLGGSDG